MKALWILLLASTACAQSARVVQLSPSDVPEAQRVYAALAEAQKAVEAFNAKVAKEYLNNPPCGWVMSSSDLCSAYPTPGWENGFIFSEDFKFIVPKPIEQMNMCKLGK